MRIIYLYRRHIRSFVEIRAPTLIHTELTTLPSGHTTRPSLYIEGHIR